MLLMCLGLCLLSAGFAGAQEVDRSIRLEQQIAQEAARAQEQIDRIAIETESMLDQYRRVLTETESLRAYNDLLERTIENQEGEIGRIEDQLETLEQTQRDVVPLMIEMAEALPRLVRADVPFRLEQRMNRAEALVEALDRADVTTSEKFRRILEAYLNEMELGRTTEGYQGRLPDGQQVDFLRVGRTLLFYQSLDGSETGWWNPGLRTFEPLEDRYRRPVADGLAIARNRVAPDLVRLPVPAPIEAER